MPIPPLKDLKCHKSCSKCHLVKHVREFYVNRATKSGLQGWCIECSREYSWANNVIWNHSGQNLHSDT